MRVITVSLLMLLFGAMLSSSPRGYSDECFGDSATFVSEGLWELDCEGTCSPCKARFETGAEGSGYKYCSCRNDGDTGTCCQLILKESSSGGFSVEKKGNCPACGSPGSCHIVFDISLGTKYELDEQGNKVVNSSGCWNLVHEEGKTSTLEAYCGDVDDHYGPNNDPESEPCHANEVVQ